MSPIAPTPETTDLCGGELSIDLAALVANYRTFRTATGGEVAAVVKADAYGLGAVPISLALAADGCRDFFVVYFPEAMPLRAALPSDARIYLLHGAWPGTEQAAIDAGLIPVLSTRDQVEAWLACAHGRGERLPAVLQFDSGMSRLGLGLEDAAWLAATPAIFDTLDVRFVMTHFACADDPGDPMNAAQRSAFDRLVRDLPRAPRTFANSALSLGGQAPYGELARAGIALYGAQPLNGRSVDVRPVVALSARVVQVRTIPAGTAVGYGRTFVAERAMRTATIGIGYADGWSRALSNRGAAFCGDHRLPIIGRVSMDSFVVDASSAPEDQLREGDGVELIGPHQSIEEVAEAAGTIAYEILTGFGRRLVRRYSSPGGPALERIY